jgi:hypothetical protein
MFQGQETMNRVAAGKTEGGQFASKINGEQELDLPLDTDEADAKYNADGSWFFPPKPRSASQSASFWEQSKVPDEILKQFMTAYETRYKAYSQGRWSEEMSAWIAKYKEDNPEPSKMSLPSTKASWEANFADAVNDAKHNIVIQTYSERPESISLYDARPLARAAQMYRFAPLATKNREEFIAAMNHPVELFDETLTVYEAEQKYNLSEISWSLAGVRDDTSKQDDLIEEVGKVKGALSEMSEKYTQILSALHEEIGVMNRQSY